MKNVAFFFVVADTLNTKSRIKGILFILLLSSMFLGIDGIYQYFTHHDFIRNRPYFMIPRIHATFATANDYGCYLVTVIPFALTSFFDKANFRKISRILILCLSMLLFICLILTVSRGAWFAFIASALFMSIWISTLAIFFLVIGIALIVTHGFYFPYLKERLQNLFIFIDTSSADRKMIWQAAFRMIMHKPWVGLGLGSFMFNFKYFVDKGYPNTTPYAHNCYLQIAAEIGLIGLLSFLFILILLFYHGIKAIKNNQRSFSWFVLLASLASILAYSVQMIVDTNFYSLDLGALFWFVLGLGAASLKGIEVKAQS